jgi:hypothetical protein
VRLPVKFLISIVAVVASVLLTSGVARNIDADFCSSRTTEAYHSPKCDWGWVVHDPKRVENVTIPHKPAYHTYSHWVLDGGTYIYCLRRHRLHPQRYGGVVYLANGDRYKLVGSVQHLGEIVTGVFAARLTGAALADVVFQTECGELQCIDIIDFSDGAAAREVFSYGASTIEVVSQPKPLIVARSSIANVVEEFIWDPKSSKCVKIRQYP